MQITFIDNRETWDSLLTQLPNPHTLQSWDWGAFKSRWGWQPTRLLWSTERKMPLAAAQILRRPIPKTPWCLFYVSKGPILAYDDLPLVRQVLHDLESYARTNNALFIKCDPDVPIAFEPSDPTIHPPGKAIKHLLYERGWHYASQQIQFKNTVILDLTPSEDVLLAAMKSKWRYNIRLAQRKGIVICQGSLTDLEPFYELYAVTSQRDGFLIRPKAYYLDVWGQYLQAHPRRATLLLAKVDHVPIAGLMLFYFGQTAWYMYGASLDQHRNLMPNHLLQWEAIKAAKSLGCASYDMWGAPDVFAETDPIWGVYRFKKGFGGFTRQGLGAFDFPVHPFRYKLYNYLLPKILSFLRRRPAFQ